MVQHTDFGEKIDLNFNFGSVAFYLYGKPVTDHIHKSVSLATHYLTSATSAWPGNGMTETVQHGEENRLKTCEQSAQQFAQHWTWKLPDAKSQLVGNDPDVREDWRQKDKGMTENEMVEWHHWLNGHEFEQTLGDGEGQGSLAFCSRIWLIDCATSVWHVNVNLIESVWI